MDSNETDFNVLRQIKAHIDQIHPQLPSQIAITLGWYAFKALMDSSHFNRGNSPSLFHIIHTKESDLRPYDKVANPDDVLMLDTVFEPHYWFDLHAHLQASPDFVGDLKERIFGYHEEVITVCSLSEGVTSGVLPTLNSHLNEEKKDNVYLAVLPSINHSSDALFNAFSSLGLLLLQGAGPIVLMDRSNLDSFIGVNRVGGLLTGETITRYVSEMILDKRGLVKDLAKLSQSFKVDLFTVLMATGSSLEIYENLRNILDITLEQPLMELDLSTASLIYVLVRAPLMLQGQLSKGYIELQVNDWLKERLNLNVPQICEPIYVDEFNDRIDVVILVGGFDSRQLFRTINERISRFNRLIMEHGFYDKEVWAEIQGRLVKE